MAAAQREMTKFSGPANVMRAGLSTVSDSVSMIVRRLGRQMFQKALAEAKRFVKEFNATLTEIQMITLKTDNQMSTLGDGLIEKAQELKISISEISKSAAVLYRQGLSDQEVNERLEVISKFSKVSGAKVEDATKLITIAMNTGLVTDPQTASDIVTALGDNAATNAQQIEKGIEKAGAAAAADGTTFAELASMLTAITSTTQIGGNVAGRTLNTIFGRMNKIGTNELIVDENGNKISGSAVAKLLAAQGIKQYDELGNKRSTYDVLYALSQKWEGMTDAEQQQMANAIAGTRQYSNFSAVMQGMAEGKVDEYMKLADESSGITDKKFNVYTKSLQASLTDLQNTFDSVIADLVDKGYVQDFIEGIETMVRGVGNLVESFGGLKASLPIIMALVGALTGLKFGGGIGALIGGAVGFGLYSGLTNAGKEQRSAKDEYKEATKISEDNYNFIQEKINRASALRNNTKRNESEENEYSKLLTELSFFAGIDTDKISKSMKDASSVSDELSSSITSLKDASKEAADEIINKAKEMNDQRKGADISLNLPKESEAIVEDFNEEMKSYDEEFHATNKSLLSRFWKYDEQSGKYVSVDHPDNETNKLTEEERKALAEGFNAAYTFGAIKDEKYKNFTLDKWEDEVDGWDISQEAWDGLARYVDMLSKYDETRDNYKQRKLSDIVSSYLSGTVSSEYLPSVSQQAVKDILDLAGEGDITGSIISTVLSNILGFDQEGDIFNLDNINRAIKEYAVNKAGYTSKSIELEKYHLEDVGPTGYYYNRTDGKYYSAEDAQKIIDEANKTVEHETATAMLYSGNGQDRFVFDTLSEKQLGSKEELDKQAEDIMNNRFYFVDGNGQIHYTDENGNQFTTIESAEKAGQRWDEKFGTWTGNFTHKVESLYPSDVIGYHQETIEATRIGKAATEQQLYNQRSELAEKSYKLLNPTTGQIEEYSSESDRNVAYKSIQDELEYNKKLAEAAARNRQSAGITGSYVDIYGEKHVAKGEVEVEKLTQRYNRENKENRYWELVNGKGEVFGTFNTEEDAKQAKENRTEYREMYSGELLGYGEAGKKEAENIKKNYRNLWINGEYIGWGTDTNDWIKEYEGIEGLKIEKDVETVDVRYLITFVTDVKLFAKAVRQHWGIENSLHWCLDMCFDEDHCRVRVDNSGENFAVLRHIATNLYKSFTMVKLSLKAKRFRCSFDDEFLASVIFNMFS